MVRRPCFVTQRDRAGFTLAVGDALGFPRLLTRYTSKNHGFQLSFSFGPSPVPQLLWPLLTSRSVLRRCPFRHQARSPQVRTRSFPAQPPDLRDFALTTNASQ